MYFIPPFLFRPSLFGFSLPCLSSLSPILSPTGEPVDPPRDPRATCITDTADNASLKALSARVPDGNGKASGADGVPYILRHRTLLRSGARGPSLVLIQEGRVEGRVAAVTFCFVSNRCTVVLYCWLGVDRLFRVQ